MAVTVWLIPAPRHRVTVVTLLLGLALSLGGVARATTLAEFGFGSMRVNGQLPLGTRPLLVIIANYQGAPEIAQHDWDSLVFGSAGPSVANYYREISNGRFTWNSAGLLRANFTQAERMTRAGHAQIVEAALAQNPGYRVLDFDADGDGTVRGSELSILILNNLVDGGGQTVPVVVGPLSLQVSMVGHRDSLMTSCHELCHTLGAVDLYGNTQNLHTGISLMGSTIVTDSNRGSFHLDPWHKLALGWSEPRIVSLRGNGQAILPAAQFKHADAPVLLFDPLRGTEEFYLLEYRTPAPPSGGAGFDANVTGQGLLIWHAWQSPDHNPVMTAVHTTLPFPVQGGWTICSNCLGNFYRPNQGASHCPSGGTHRPFDTHDFSMVLNSPADPGQPNWRWCSKCQGMFYGGNGLPTRCPADNGPHDGSTSANYTLRFQGQQPNRGQRGWAWCRKCQALFYTGASGGGLNPTGGVCPASGQHDASASAEYSLHYQVYGVFSESATDNVLGASTGWPVGSLSPFSRWFADGAEVRVRTHPVSQLHDGDALLVEWISELPPPPFSGETWIDYVNPGFLRLGTFDLPFGFLAEAIGYTPFYSRILVKPGTSRETLTIRQSIRLEAPLGAVTIGR